MAPTTLDLLVLTFNCAKNFINAAVFANHLQAAFGQNATGLPDLVVLSLQEIAPMGHSFIGGYFLNPYVARFEEAINLAAVQYDDERQNAVSVTPTQQGPKKHYSLVKTGNVGYTALLLFARDPDRLRDIQEAEVGFGAADMGNKGAVGVRALYQVSQDACTEVTFVATHLAAMEWNLHRRNANWAAIMRGMAFENPEAIVANSKKTEEPVSRPSSDADAGERARLLPDENDEGHMRLRQRLHEISVFKPGSHLFVAGDLNYRISTSSPPPNAAFPNMDPDSEHHYSKFLHLDQLTREKAAGRTMHGLSESQIRFPPTYKYDVLPQKTADEHEVPWEFAPHRYPSWTDRVLYLDLPSWVKEGPESPAMNVRAYNAMPVIRTSDHRPVFLRIEVPLVSPSDLAPPPELTELSSSTDPRVRLPMELDPEAWERRAAARKREVMAGWSMLLWSTKQGALVLTSMVALGAGAYWLYRSS
ncbi:endonuclease/Exonuclease/phosphatase [Stachybotrys elegans]|uniref:Endonuclease/Exonuclease/phosphatase n=1 Tax=Stachybotrys elegans TaxID=80388 RepID=A0A8K0SPN5_9HYPO|nr:endonuclease/Exonuclease/phosphatase [Stachybotrys elegans]